jgi:peptide/nickel transport system substrate-binding protein
VIAVLSARSVLSVALLAYFLLGAPPAQAQDRDGGSVTIGSVGPDTLDPQVFQTVQALEPLWLVYTPLLTYPRAEGSAGTTPVPGLAEALPAISDAGRTYTLRLRSGLRYSNGAPVMAGDFEHTVKRLLRLDGPYSSYYLGIAGAPRFQRRGGDIAGITADDTTGRIQIRLTRPDGMFTNLLAMPYVGLLPQSAPFRKTEAPPGIGPYTITGTAGGGFVMRRNAAFNVPGIPAGHLDAITLRASSSRARLNRDVLGDGLDYTQDAPPRSLRRTLLRRHRDRYKERAGSSTYWFFMNHRVRPFNKRAVRKAVNYAVNRSTLARAGGLALGCSFIPPAVPGYSRRLDRSRCPWGGRPKLRKARALVRRAGVRGSRVRVWAPRGEPRPSMARAFARTLRSIGFRARVKLASSRIYFNRVGSRRTRAQTGLTNWYSDFPHPANLFLPSVSGSALRSQPTFNSGFVRDRRLDRRLAQLLRRPTLTPPVIRGWGALNGTLVRSAHIVPFGHDRVTTFMSERMDFAHCSRVHPVFGNDYSSWCLK